jgi:hypothetical protein
MHFISKGYVMCDQSMSISMNDSDFGMKLVKECHKNCPKKCKKTYFNNNIIIREFSKVSNDTILEFFPTKSPHFKYSETLSVDFNQLIYNCGGILGLWFGLSPLSIDDLITILSSNSVILFLKLKMKSKIIKFYGFILYLLFELKRVIILLYNSFRRLNINLRLEIEIEY